MLYQQPQGSQNNLNKLTVGTIIEKVKNIYTIPDTSVENYFFTIHWVERGERKEKQENSSWIFFVSVTAGNQHCQIL